MTDSPHSTAATPAHAALYTALNAIVGPKGLTSAPADIAPWLTDWRGRYHGKALALVSPANTQQVSDVVKIAAQFNVPIVPQGGNSGMVGGATPDDSGTALLLSMRRMNAIRSFNTDSGHVVAEAGVILQHLHDAAASRQMRFPLTLGGKGSATIGGLVSTNAGGTQVLRHGNMRALVDGLEAVMPDGSIYNGLAALKKDNRGYDLRHLLIGAEGTLGIVTAATLRVIPALVDRAVIWVGLSSPQAARALFVFMQAHAKDSMEGFELLPDHCLTSVLTHINGTRAPLDTAHDWHVLIELVQDDPQAEAPFAQAQRLLGQALEQGKIDNAVIAANERQAEAFWKIRDAISEAERANGPAMQHDISVPVADMADFIMSAKSAIEAQFPGVKGLAFGHLGDGNVHFHVCAPEGADRAAWTQNPGAAISAAMHDLVIAANGSISAEHGIGQMKRDELQRLSSPARNSALRAIKNALDPLGIMNPGKLIPLAPDDQAT